MFSRTAEGKCFPKCENQLHSTQQSSLHATSVFMILQGLTKSRNWQPSCFACYEVTRANSFPLLERNCRCGCATYSKEVGTLRSRPLFFDLGRAMS